MANICRSVSSSRRSSSISGRSLSRSGTLRTARSTSTMIWTVMRRVGGRCFGFLGFLGFLAMRSALPFDGPIAQVDQPLGGDGQYLPLGVLLAQIVEHLGQITEQERDLAHG